MRSRVASGLVWIAIVLAATPALAHSYHVSLSEAEFNPASGNLEVSLKVLTQDLERALAHRFGKKKIPPLEEADRQIASYLATVFRLQCPNVSSPTLAWVGKEIEVKETWLYFEFPLTDGLGGCSIENRFLFAQEPTQLNTLHLTTDGESVSVNLSRERPGFRVEGAH